MEATAKNGGLLVSRILQVLTTTITFGLVMTIGMILAPVLFGNLPRPLAIVAMTAVIAKASSFMLSLVGVFSFGSLLRVFIARPSQPKMTKSFMIKLVLALAFIAFSLYNLLLIVPSMVGLVAAGQSSLPAFQTAHGLSTQLFAIQGGLALLLTVLLI